MKLIHAITLSTLLAPIVNAGGYVAAGIGLHQEGIDCPEVCYGADTLARIRIGYDWHYITAEAVHVSAPQLRESGRGMNAVFVDVVYRF